VAPGETDLAANRDGGRVARPLSGRARINVAVRIASVGSLLAATLAVLALFLSDAFIQRARTVVDTPSAELSAAETAATFDPWSLTPHYLQAAAYETMGNRASAFKQLNDALALEPDNSATLGVLGDFEARNGNLAAARAYYRRALSLNPLDTGLQQLARIGKGASGA
jgi:tetratricopeptide (TPR) repeat protein